MKRGLVKSLLLASIGVGPLASASDPQAMQQMMEVMGEVQACMAGVDQSKLQGLEARSNAIHSELSELCKAGKRDEAQQKGLKYALEITNDPELKKLLACGEKLKSAMAAMPTMPGMPAMPDMSLPQIDENNHVCDQIKE
jgi:hypothetical protein